MTVYYSELFIDWTNPPILPVEELSQMPESTDAIELLKSADGWPRRSPDAVWWHGRPGRCSRDSLTPLVCFLVASSNAKHKPAWSSIVDTLSSKNYLRANNIKPNHRYDTPEEHKALSTPDVPFEPQSQSPDYIGPDIWSLLLRGGFRQEFGAGATLPKFSVLYPLLCVLDLHHLGNAILLRYKPKTDLRNQLLKTHCAAHISPTFISRLAWRVFLRSNPGATINAWCSKIGEPRWDLLATHLLK